VGRARLFTIVLATVISGFWSLTSGTLLMIGLAAFGH
jgi:hypothetical protein